MFLIKINYFILIRIKQVAKTYYKYKFPAFHIKLSKYIKKIYLFITHQLSEQFIYVSNMKYCICN